MSYTLDALKDDIRRELSHGSPAAREAVCRHVSRALTDREFVATHLKDRPAGSDPREVLYEDPSLGFRICAHVYDGKAIGSPHDHGSSWASYNNHQAEKSKVSRQCAPAGSRSPSQNSNTPAWARQPPQYY
jgi:hypothetical protein